MGSVHARHFLEGTVAGAHLHVIPLRFGRRFKRVFGRLPSEPVSPLVLFVVADCKVTHGKRLYHVGAVVALGKIPQHPFVDGTGDHEPERRVETETHVREILVAEKLKQESRHTACARFGIVLVEHRPARPCRVRCGAYVIDDCCHHVVGEISPREARPPSAPRLSSVGAVDCQCAYRAVIVCQSGISVPSHGEIYRDAESLPSRVHRRASAQVVHPRPAPLVVIGVVRCVIRHRVDRIRNTRPLQEVARTLAETRVTACRWLVATRLSRATLYVAHSAADLHGICCEGSVGSGAYICESDQLLHPLVKLEVA